MTPTWTLSRHATWKRAARSKAGCGVPGARVQYQSKMPPGHPEHVPGPVARQRIDALADQLAERVEIEREGRIA